MRTRILSALFLAPIFIASIFLNPLLFVGIMTLIATLMLFEWYDITHSKKSYLLIGYPIIILPTLSLIHIRLNENGEYAIFTYFAMIWSVDVFAMIGGRKFGGTKLAPIVSPKKTWSGLFCGSLACSIIVFTLNLLLPTFPIPLEGYKLIIFGFVFGFIEQFSDLFISYFKRKFNIKDSGSIIPGHGGMLDRFDGIILTSPLLLGLLI